MAIQVASNEKAEQFTAKMKQVGLKAKEDEAAAQAAVLGAPYINLFRFAVTPEALSMVARERARELQTVCFLFLGEEIRLGAVNPTLSGVVNLKHELEERHHARVDLYLISENSFSEAMKLYDKLPEIKIVSRDVVIKEEDLQKWSKAIGSFTELDAQVKKVSVTDFVTVMIGAGLKFEATDIHLEAEEAGLMMRFRLDGVLQPVATLLREIAPRIVSRLKLLSGLKINITNKPQDGRFTVAESGQKIDVRVSMLPTIFGESVVMRILKPMAAVQFDGLGVAGQTLAELKRQVERPNGMIITTGPTGSGKTTTLYSILRKLNKTDIKIITLEDPVEYKLAGINQSQIDPSRDYTFAKGLRSILRQDPDVVMVGEIRDLETAEIAIQAALTGHLMLSTLHTNSAAGTIPRFLSMGVKPFLLAPALNAIIGQRLVRRLCAQCKKEAILEKDILEKVRATLSALSPGAPKADLDNLKFFAATGCEACQNLGYKGRIGIYEVMVMNKEIEQLILKGEVSEYVMQEVAVKNGMITMAQDGLLKALEGITSVEEVFRAAE